MRRLKHLTAAVLASLISMPMVGVASERTPYVNYILKCSGCHGADGSGSKIGGIPEIPNNIGVLSSNFDGRLYLMHVPGISASGLNDHELATLMNWLTDKWGDGSQVKPYTATEIATLKQKPLDDIVKFRRTLVDEYQKEGKQLAEYPWP